MVIGPDNYIYVNIGDVLGYRNDSTKSKVLNFVNGLVLMVEVVF